MSNQNFDTNSPFSSSPQPLPIAQQLGSQVYLSQVQDKRHELVEDAKKPSPEKQQKFSDVRQSEEAVPQRENKMDAFFRQAEEEEEREKEHAKAASQESQDSAPAASETIQETPGNLQDVATPVVEIPALTKPASNSVQNVENSPSTNDGSLQSEGTPIVSGQNESPFSVNSFGSSFSNPAFGQPDQSIPDTSQTPPPVQMAQTSPPVQMDQTSPPVQMDQTTTPVQMNFSAGVDVKPPTTSGPTNNPSTSDGDQNTPTTFASKESQQSEEAARKVTGAAALSAGMAAAGIGAWASQVVSDKPSENGERDGEQSISDASLMSDPSDQLRQQMANEELELQSRGSLATYELSNGSPQFESTVVDASQSNVAQPNVEVVPQPIAGEQSAGEMQAAEAEVNEAEVNEADVNEADVNEAGLGESQAFEFPQPTESLSQVTDDIGVSKQGPIAVTQTPSSGISNVGSGEANSQNSSPQTERPPVELLEELHVPHHDPEVEHARLAAEQKAQQIKAERAKLLAEHPPVQARPYGAAAKDEGVTASQDSGNQVPRESAFQQPHPSLNAGPAPAAAPKLRAEQKSQLIEDIVNPDGTTQRRKFPLELFNRHLLRNLRSGVVFVDHQRRVQLWSKGAETMTGIFSEAVMDRPLYPQTFNLRFDDGAAVTLEHCPIAKCLETMQNVSGDYRILNATSHEVKVGITISPVIDEDRYVNGAIIIFDDHSVEIDLQRQLKDLYEFSVLDPLTQVANRAEFERVLEEYVRAFNQSDSFNCSIIICDLDYFKSINDKFGHAVGDQALIGFAEMLKNYVRSQDLVARYGGEEFVILCADCDTDSALQRAEKIRMALFKTPQTMLNGKSISASFGVSELRQGDTAMEFFVRADTALLKAKEMGRNRVVIADQRDASRNVGSGGDDSISGLQWRQQRREHTALVCEEFQTNTPVPVLVEKLRGFIIEKDAWLQRVDQEFLSMEVDFEDPKDYSRKGSFTLNIEFKESEDSSKSQGRRRTYIRISIFPGRKKKWFSTNHTDVVKYLLTDLRSYLMINDEASHLTVDMATENVRD